MNGYVYPSANGKSYQLRKSTVLLKNQGQRDCYFFTTMIGGMPKSSKGIPVPEVPTNRIVDVNGRGHPFLRTKPAPTTPD